MDFSAHSILAGFFFGVWGVWLIRRGRATAHMPAWIAIGAGLIAYPYFVTSPWLLWGIGLVLLALARKL